MYLGRHISINHIPALESMNYFQINLFPNELVLLCSLDLYKDKVHHIQYIAEHMVASVGILQQQSDIFNN